MTLRFLCMTSALALTAGSAMAEMNFNRIASFATVANMAQGEDAARETSAEIIAATPDGNMLVYTDSPLGVLGLIDITDPAAPKPLGNVALNGEPTSVAVVGNHAFVGVNTSESYTSPSGRLAVIDLASKTEIAACDLGGQPDSVAVNKAGNFAAIAIENERNEEAGDGRTGQMPAGYVVLVDLAGKSAACDTLRKIDLTGLAEVSPEDPEPEFVAINDRDETVVTLQENNHLVVIGRDGTILKHFPAGEVTLDHVDTEKDGKIDFSGKVDAVKREPDAVKWIDDTHFAIANEGDMDGGSRGWSIFGKDGSLVYDSGMSFEYAAAAIGHFPDKRANKKGVELESIEFGVFGGTPLVFVGSERGSVVGVYDVTNPAAPVLKQMLPSGIGPEGYVAIPGRNLMASANEVDLGKDGGARSHVMIYQYQDAPAVYPMLTSAGSEDAQGAPIGWGAISGQVAGEDGFLYAISDSVYSAAPTIFKIDISARPARIVAAIPVTRNGEPAQNLDLEGITTDGTGFWLASEGRTDKDVPHALYRVDASGAIQEEVMLPEALLANEIRYGFEGITRVGDQLWMAVQREWKDDAEGQVKLVAYNPASKAWGAVRYPLDKAEAGWVGLSDIVAHGGKVYLIERDNQIGENARIKTIYSVAESELKPAAIGGDDALPVVNKVLVRDLLPDLLATGGFAVDKVEGLAILPDGTAWVSTDNDGLDDSSGETLFFAIGKIN